MACWPRAPVLLPLEDRPRTHLQNMLEAPGSHGNALPQKDWGLRASQVFSSLCQYKSYQTIILQILQLFNDLKAPVRSLLLWQIHQQPFQRSPSIIAAGLTHRQADLITFEVQGLPPNISMSCVFMTFSKMFKDVFHGFSLSVFIQSEPECVGHSVTFDQFPEENSIKFNAVPNVPQRYLQDGVDGVHSLPGEFALCRGDVEVEATGPLFSPLLFLKPRSFCILSLLLLLVASYCFGGYHSLGDRQKEKGGRCARSNSAHCCRTLKRHCLGRIGFK